MVTAFYAAILGLWLVYLYMTVVKYRREYHVGLGDGDREDLLKAVRIHGNFVETVPYVLILMMLIEKFYAQPWLLHIFGILLVISRVCHYIGLRESTGVSKGRLAAGITTMALVSVGSLLLIFVAVTSGAVFTF